MTTYTLLDHKGRAVAYANSPETKNKVTAQQAVKWKDKIYVYSYMHSFHGFIMFQEILTPVELMDQDLEILEVADGKTTN
jgi:hypothetical protein